MDKEAEALKEFLQIHGMLHSFECFIETEDLTLTDYGIEVDDSDDD